MELASSSGGVFDMYSNGWIGTERSQRVMDEGAVYVSDHRMVYYYYALGLIEQDYVTRLSRDPVEKSYLGFYCQRGAAIKSTLNTAFG